MYIIRKGSVSHFFEFRLLVSLLYPVLSVGMCVRCHIALAFRFSFKSCLISRAVLLEHICGTFMPRVGFEPTTLAFGRAKTVHALDRAHIVISWVQG
jgi:hypothetical protein